MFPFFPLSICFSNNTSLYQFVARTGFLVCGCTFWWQTLWILMRENLCCETAMLYVYVYIATRMALSHKSIKIKSWCTCSIADMGPKKRKNLENEGSTYLPPTCPACTITAKPVHLISWEQVCPSVLSSPAPLSPHRTRAVVRVGCSIYLWQTGMVCRSNG